MRVIVHLSDIHFGRVAGALLDPLRQAVLAVKPDLVCVSGDLTQRARVAQFKRARAFLDSLPEPQLVVPGNHDMPFYDLFRRFTRPFDRYRRFIDSELEPVFQDEALAVVGVNTARRRALKGGRISLEQIERVGDRLCRLPDEMLKAVVTHHPFDLPIMRDPRHLVGRAEQAVRTMARCGADLLLAGHFHRSYSGSTIERYRIEGYSAVFVQAGTAASTRVRGEENSFNVVRFEHPHMRVENHYWNSRRGAFCLRNGTLFAFRPDGWAEADAAEDVTSWL